MPEDEEDRPVRLSDHTLVVRYTGRSHSRVLSRNDLSGEITAAGGRDLLVWGGAGAEISWDSWEDFCGTRERATEMIGRLDYEFELAGPGSATLAEEAAPVEFDIGG